jgi:abortive infection bacteriophage resistance protein
VEFDKRAKTSQELLAQLIDRGMVIDDQPQALQWLEHVNYYRLTPYWLPYRTTDKGGEHKFREHTTFSEVIQHYEIDESIFISLLKHLESVRNTCAHHARVWNRKFVIKTKLPTQANFKSSKNLNRGSDASGHIYNTIILLDYLESIILGIGELSHLVSELLEEYPSVNQTNMGYPI